MLKNIINIIQFLTIFSALTLSFKVNAQEINVIDNKGTIRVVHNNTVTTASTAPTSPVEGDIWYNTNSTPNIITIWDGSAWVDLVSSSTIAHTGVTGSLFFADTDGQPTYNENQLFWDNTLNRLSIGTPLAGTNKLTVQGTIRASGFNNANGTVGLPSYRFSSDSDTGMYRIGTNQLGFTTNGTNALSIDATQNVSISQNLSVTGSYLDSSGDAGTSGQILSSIGTGTNWITPATDPDESTTNEVGAYTDQTTIATRHKIGEYQSSPTATAIDVNETLTSINQATDNENTDVGSGARTIATYNDENGAATTINETVTSLAQNDTPTSPTNPSVTGEITFTDENGNSSTAQVVSADANNTIQVGTDGGAFYGGPTIKAAAKVTMTYNADATTTYISHAMAKEFNIDTITRTSEGDYDIVFDTAMDDDNYIIQLSIRDCGGNCPGNTNQNYDDPGITYYNQSATGFSINIGDSDNGGGQKDDIDLEFMFSVIDF